MRSDLASVLLVLRPDLAPETDYRVGIDAETGEALIRDWFAPPAARPSDAEIEAFVLPLVDTAARFSLENQYRERLRMVSYDGRLFDMTAGANGLVGDWLAGAREIDAVFGAGTWGPEYWPAMSDGAAPYELADAGACAAWALAMFIAVAGLQKARDAHVATIAGLATQTEVDAYDVSAGWPS